MTQIFPNSVGILSALFCLAFFLVAIGLVEYLDRRSLNPARTWISSYITDAPLSWLEDLGFVALAASLELMPHIFKAGLAQTVALSAAGIAALLVVASRKYFPTWFPSLSASTITRIHVLAAGVAFITAFGGILIGSSISVKVVMGLSVLSCGLVFNTDSQVKDQMIEKILAGGICIAGLVRLISLVR